MQEINVIGGGLAGTEAAYQIAKRGIKVKLYEMKPKKFSPAHFSENLAEIVCSNSFKSNSLTNACGLLKEELRRLDSLLIHIADQTKVPAGQALAVDREKFSELVTAKIMQNENIEMIHEEIKKLPEGITIIATGPLTSDAFASEIGKITGKEKLFFYDAAAPIVLKESIQMEKAFTADRYGKGESDYINCPMTKEEYENFYTELIHAEVAHKHEFEKGELFEGCMPIEEMARRGPQTLTYGPLKPVGFDKKYYAVVQLRQDNADGSMYNLVGFQTNLKFGEQKRVFRLIPALENAEFIKYGVMHRNTYINSTELLTPTYQLKGKNVFFAGQISGVEGYVESIASGMVAAYNAVQLVRNGTPIIFPKETMIGALASYISTLNHDFQPMNANFGILNCEKKIKNKIEKYEYLSNRSLRRFRRSYKNIIISKEEQMKRIIWLLALICFMVCSTSVYAAVSVQLNGDLIDFTDSNGNKVEAQIINSRTMVPMRKIFELLNAKVEWNAENKTVIAAQNDILIQLQIDNDIAELTKNGVTEKIKLDAKPVIVDDRTLVPLRFISESLNKQVGWDSENATAIIIDYDYFLNKIKEKSPLLSELLLTNPKNFSLNITRTYTDLITNHEEVSNVMVDEKEDSNGVENVKIRFEGTSELFREIVSEGWDDVDLTIAYLEDGISYSTTNSVLEKMLLQKEEKFADLHLEGTTRDSFGDMIKNQLNINEKSMNITTFQSITEEFNQFLSLFRYNNTASSSSIIANNINYQNANLTKADFTKFDNIIFDNKVLNLYNIINRLLFNYDIELEKLLYDYSNIDVNLSVIKNENHLSMNTTVELTNDYQEKVVYQILLNEQ